MQLSSTVVVTGSSGFIGRQVLHRLAADHVTFRTIDIRALEHDGAVELLAGGADGSKVRLADLKDCTLVHLAWCPPVRDCLQPHVEQLSLLAGLLDGYSGSIGRVVAIGSAEEYGARCGCLRESDAMNAGLSPYGWGKRSAQMLLETWCTQHQKRGLWLRPFTVYGEGQQGQMAIPYAVRQALRGEVANFSAGTQQRDFIHVDDVARAIVLAVTGSWTAFDIINVGTGVATRLRDTLEKISVLFDVPGKFRFGVHAMRHGEPEVQFAATIKAAETLGFAAQITLDEGLCRLQRALRNQHDRT